MTRTRLEQILNNFPKLKIAIVGDYFLDKWLEIDRSLDELSLETGLTAYQVTAKRCYAGAAGTVVQNLAALGAGELHALGFLGDDGEGFEVLRFLQRLGVKTEMLFTSDCVMTPTYTKPLFMKKNGFEETNRLDHKNVKTTPPELEQKVIDSIWKIAPHVDAIIALDQLCSLDCGVITQRIRGELAKIGETYPNLVLYADSRAFIDQFRNTTIKCNNIEAHKIYCSATNQKETDPANLEEIKKSLLYMSELCGKKAFVSCGSKGTMTMDGSGQPVLVPAVSLPPGTEIDIVGAGDSCSSGIVTALSSGASPEEAALVGNLVAANTIQIIGTTGTASRDDVLAMYDKHFQAFYE